MNLLNKIKKTLRNPKNIPIILLNLLPTKWIPDEIYLRLLYRLYMGKRLNLRSPITFNEKLQWLKLYNHRDEYTMMVDKHKVRKYVIDTIGEEYLIPLLGAWEKFSDIDFNTLPNQFVLKCNHDCGSIMICKNKGYFDINKAGRSLNKALKSNYYWNGREWPYKNVKPLIIAEKYVVDEPNEVIKDYKFFCFNGVPKVMFVVTDRGKNTHFDFFDMEFKHLPIINGHENSVKIVDKPECFEQMKVLASALAKGLPFVRVDFYYVSGKIYFGELTFFHWGGKVPFEPEEWDYKFGEWLKLPEKHVGLT